MIQTLQKLLIFYLTFLFILNPALSIYEGPESNAENDPIPELYENVSPEYMNKVITNLKTLLENYVFSDILNKPPKPYDYSVKIQNIFDNIEKDKERPFYEFYRDIKMALSSSHDANLDITGGIVPLKSANVSFGDYRQCLPFKFYVDYDEKKEAKMFIREYETCSKYYNDTVKDFIKKHKDVALVEVNGTDPFNFIQEFGTEFFKFKNPDTHFSIMIDSIHDNYLSFTPLSKERLKPFKLNFTDGEILELQFYIIKTPDKVEEKVQQSFSDITWAYSSKDGEIKCRVDDTNKLNVLFIKKLFAEDSGSMTIAKCVNLFQNENRLVIITSQLWEEDAEKSFLYLNALFPKLTLKYNMALKNTDLNKKLFEKDKTKFLDAKTCMPFDKWEDFEENTPDDYGDNIQHKRTKPFNPIGLDRLLEYNANRKDLITKGNLRKSTDVLILTDTVNFGPASLFIKTIQNNGAAIIASYAGNPKLNKTAITTLDASLDPVICTTYEDISDNYKELNNSGIVIYKIPHAEAFESTNITGDYKYPMAFKVNKVDEITNIYHYYNDTYYDEFINKTKEIFEKYNEKQECNKENPNLVYENNYCIFNDDSQAHGGFKCGQDGKWSSVCQKSYCNYAFFYDKTNDKCQIDTCIADEIIEINEETEKTIEVKPNKRYIINLNTNLYTYFFKSPMDEVIFYSNFKECSRYCVVKKNVDYIYLNYHKNLTSPVNVNIISKKVNLIIESAKVDSPHFADIRPMSKSLYIFQLTKDNYLYFDSFDKSTKFYYAIYDENMIPDDIININKKYFHEGLDQIMYLPANSICIGFFQQQLGFTKMYFYNALPEIINLKNGDKTILYLNKSISKYQLNFEGNQLPFAIRLNEKTNGTFTIKVNDTTEEKNISISDKYFIPSFQSINKIIEISNISIEKGEGIFIEILYKANVYETIDKEITNYKITKDVTLLQYNPTDASKKIMKITITSQNAFGLGAYGGPSKNNFAYYSQFNISQNTLTVPNYFIKLEDPLKIIQNETEETYYVSLMFSNTTKDQEIFITIKYEADPLEELYEPITEDYAKNLISNLSSIVEKYYVYNEIAQNPPKPNGLENYTHAPINISKALNALETKNRKFYDFYREIREILGTPRDLHFRIYALKTPKGIKFSQITACLPFSFYVDKVGENAEEKIYIKYYEDCGTYFSEEIRNDIKEKEKQKTPLEKINGKDPFEFIQEMGRKYIGVKSPHGHFTFMKKNMHSFPLYQCPYNKSELSMKFEFKENLTLNLDYYIYIPNFSEMNNLLGSYILNEEEFEEFLENERKKNYLDVIEPNIFEMIKRYKKHKGILLEEENESQIKWDYQLIEGKNYFKCRVDENNKLNVILQNSFSLNNDNALNVINNCARLFHKNDYKIVVIEDYNGGGYGIQSFYLQQLLQVKIQNRGPYGAFRISDFINYDFEIEQTAYLNVETCKPYYTLDEFLNGTTDDYSKGDDTILHKKTKYFETIPKENRIMLNKIRQELDQTKNTKKPTDIIIFTDSFAYSATSMFIKGIQNQGGAILVGYNGNPKLEDKYFDASLSPSSVYNFAYTKEYNNLNTLGFQVIGISLEETFDEDYTKPNPIPREYKVDVIDERSKILEAYSDDNYELFMTEANRIFKKYNEDGECNPNNNLLALDDANCKFSDTDEHAHGGYLCGTDGKWNKTKCQKYYCDNGYYYSKLQDKCIRDYCTNDPLDKEIILNGPYNEVINLDKNNNYEYTLRIQTDKYIYFFEANEPGFMHYEINNPCPSSICVLQMNQTNDNKIHLNYFRNATEKNVTIKITSVEGFTGMIQSGVSNQEEVQRILPLPQKLIMITESKVDFIYYPKAYDNATKMFYVEYTKEMKINDIVNINRRQFREFKGGIIETQPGKVYIFAVETENPGMLFGIALQPKVLKKDIVITNTPSPLVMYFTKDITEYTIDFKNNKNDRIIQLSKSTLESEITILNKQTEKEFKLNSNNPYYTFDNANAIFNGILTMKVSKGNYAVVEFLFSPIDLDVIEDKEITEHKIAKPITVVKFDKNNKGMNINITLTSKYKKNFSYSFLTYYSNSKYIPYPEAIQPTLAGKNDYLIKIYNKKEQLVNNEYFALIIYIDKTALTSDEILITKIEDTQYPISELYQEVTPEYMKEVIQNLITLVDSFVFTDILKNPPKPYNEDKVNIISELEKLIDNKNKPFYEFYRDIKLTLSKTRDANLDILGEQVPLSKGIYNFEDYRMCLPFRFYLDYNDKKETKIYIKEYEFCSKYYDKTVIETINKYKNISLEKINDTDAFEYIHNFSQEFYNLKNRDNQFFIMMDSIPDNTLVFQPLSYQQLNYMKLKFNNSEEFETHFHLLKSKVEESNDIKEEIKENQINWNITSPNGEMKCRVDETNKLNVIFFKSFYVEKEEDSLIDQCADIFYSNDYRILIITSLIWEGNNDNAIKYTQMLFPKLDVQINLAMKQTQLNKDKYDLDTSIYLDPRTCLPYKSWNDFIEKEVDTYGEGIIHNRTKIYSPISQTKVKKYSELREKLIKKGHLKKATDILIMTDTVNNGAASLFIKTIQSNGGAIIASYGGNPKLVKEKIEQLDASLDPVYNSQYEKSNEYKKLLEKGISIYNIPYAEAFENINVTKNEIPLAFKVNKVDEITDLYHFYDDAYYEEFINKAKEILDKYNDTCSKENQNLIYESNECEFGADIFAHGGYPCGSNGQWDKTINKTSCKKSYCDVGYYYDKVEGKCINDICVNNPNVREVLLNESYDKEITITPNDNTKYNYKLNNKKYIYFFEASEPGYLHYDVNNPCPSSICALQPDIPNHKNEIYLNYFFNATKEIKIKITSVPNFEGVVQSVSFSKENNVNIITALSKIIFILESKVDYIYYAKTYENSTKIYCAEYKKEMPIKDIVDINTNYFKEVKGPIIESPANKIYIIAFTSDEVGSLMEFMVQPKSGEKEISIPSTASPMLMYLIKDSEYTIDFRNNKHDRMIQLSKSISDSEINIKNMQTGKEVTLNSNNAYYSFDNNANSIFNGKLTIKVTKGNNAMVEFLYAPIDHDVINDKEITNHKITKPTIINFGENTKDMNVYINITSKNQKEFAYSYLTYYSKNNYIPYPGDILTTIKGKNEYKLTFYNKNENLENGEAFGLLIFVDKTALANDEILINKKEETVEQESKGLPTWAIVVISIASVVVLIVIAIIIWKCVVKKDQVDSELISSLTKGNNKENNLSEDP